MNLTSLMSSLIATFSSTPSDAAWRENVPREQRHQSYSEQHQPVQATHFLQQPGASSQVGHSWSLFARGSKEDSKFDVYKILKIFCFSWFQSSTLGRLCWSIICQPFSASMRVVAIRWRTKYCGKWSQVPVAPLMLQKAWAVLPQAVVSKLTIPQQWMSTKT